MTSFFEMSDSRYTSFRGFLTERFNALAVEVFEEVGSIVEEYCEENKRLRSILRMTLDPVIKLTKIDAALNHYNGSASAVSDNHMPSEPLLKKCKEEEDDCDSHFGTEQRQSVTQTDGFSLDDIKVVTVGEEHIETASNSTATASNEEMTTGECPDGLSAIPSVVSKELWSSKKKQPAAAAVPPATARSGTPERLIPAGSDSGRASPLKLEHRTDSQAGLADGTSSPAGVAAPTARSSSLLPAPKAPPPGQPLESLPPPELKTTVTITAPKTSIVTAPSATAPSLPTTFGTFTLAPSTPATSSPTAGGEDVAVDQRNIPGYQQVDSLAEYLVELRKQASLVLESRQTETIVSLWRSMDSCDRRQAGHAARPQGRVPGGRSRAPEQLSAPPGLEAAARCPSGSSSGPAQRPDCCRLVENLFIRLCDLHPNPPGCGATANSRWSLVLRDYHRIRQIVGGSALLMEVTGMRLVEVNQQTLVQWHSRRQKRAEPSGRPQVPPPALPVSTRPQVPPPALPVSTQPLQEAGVLRAEPTKARETRKRQPPKSSAHRRQRAPPTPPPRPIMPKEPAKRKLLIAAPAPAPFLAPRLVPPGGVLQLVFPVAAAHAPPDPALRPIHASAEEAEFSRKRPYRRVVAANTCKRCGQFRTAETGHSQYRGRVFCPGTEPLTKEQWLEKMKNLKKIKHCNILCK